MKWRLWLPKRKIRIHMSSFNKALDSKTHRHTRTVGDNLPHTKLCHYSYMQVHILFYYRQTAGRVSLPIYLLCRHRTAAARPAAIHKRVNLHTGKRANTQAHAHRLQRHTVLDMEAAPIDWKEVFRLLRRPESGRGRVKTRETARERGRPRMTVDKDANKHTHAETCQDI